MADGEKIVFCQIDAHLDTNPKIREGGRNAREVFEFVLRRCAIARSAGVLPDRYIGIGYLAEQLMMTESDARDGVLRAVTSRLLEINETSHTVKVVGWSEEWGRYAQTHAQRQAAYRARKAANLHSGVTKCDASTSRVTVGDKSDALDKSRLEKNSRGTKPRTAASIPDDWTPREQELAMAKAGGLDAEREAAQFRDHHAAKGTRFKDWHAGFRTWLRNAAKWKQERQPAQQTLSAPKGIDYDDPPLFTLGGEP